MLSRWIRRLIRHNTRPMELNAAELWKRRLSLAYGFFAWNAFAIVLYSIYSGKRDWATFHGLPEDKDTPAVHFSKMMDIPRAKVIRMSGFNQTEAYDIDNTEIFDSQKDFEE